MTSTTYHGSGEGPLSLSTCVGWGVGTLAVAVVFNTINVLLLRYLTDTVGIGAALAGSLIGLSKLYDALIDPMIGGISDRSRSPRGRRRPFVLVGGLMLAVAVVVLFHFPGGIAGTSAILYLGAALLFYSTAYAVFTVPYMAMPAEMTSDYQERSHLISFRVYAAAVASLIATFAGPLLIARGGGGQAGHGTMSLFVAAVAAVAAIVCFRTTRTAPFHYAVAQPRIGLVGKIWLIATNRPFMLLMAIKLLQLTALAVTQAATPFLFKQVLRFSDTLLGLYFLVFYMAMIVSQRFWLRIARRAGKRLVYMIATAVYAVMYLSWYFVHTGEPLYFTFLRAIGLGVTAGAVLLFGQSLLPDTMEWDYRRTGMRREGMLSALYTIVEKIAYALGAAMTGIVLGRAGYVAAHGAKPAVQPQSAVDAIYVLASLAPMGLLLLSCVALAYYDLTEAKLREDVDR
ncbi:MFS transporter [Sphingomonas bacterium]|uniref:MFS transporter n=1 Tax=Sphingomonas bacterium TaxID=1895847 RepID=UPI001575D85F|nr:MFS transporter [Sphingomonas bacterium]